jgi:hypothetical protein
MAEEGGGFNWGYLAAAAGPVIDKMFGGESYRSQKRALRTQYAYAGKYGPRVQRAHFDQQMASFEKHGIHPLFGLGGGANIGSTSFSMPGQASTGSHFTEAIMAMLEYNLREKEIDQRKDWLHQQAMDSAMRVIDNKMGNDNAIKVAKAYKDGTVLPAVNENTQEIKKGEVDTHMEGHPEQKTGAKAPMYKFNYGGQSVWLPTEEISEFFDNIATMGTLAYTYHGNKNVDWDKLIYYHQKGTLKGYKNPKQRAKARGEEKHKKRMDKMEKRFEKGRKHIQMMRNRAG